MRCMCCGEKIELHCACLVIYSDYNDNMDALCKSFDRPDDGEPFDCATCDYALCSGRCARRIERGDCYYWYGWFERDTGLPWRIRWWSPQWNHTHDYKYMWE